MPYILMSDGKWHYTPDPNVAAQARAEGYTTSDVLPNGASAAGGMQVNPDIPLQQWALNYLMQTGQLGNAQAQTGINAYSATQNAANTRFANNTSLVGTVLPAFQALRGPAELAQYENLLAGQSSGGVPAFMGAAAGLTGNLNYNQPAQTTYEGATFENQGVGDWIKSLFGGPTQSHSAAPASAGNAMTQAVNAAGNASQTAQAGQQAAVGSGGGMGAAVGGSGGLTPLAASGGGARANAVGPSAAMQAGASVGTSRGAQPMTAYGPSSAAYDPFSGKVDTGAYARASGLSGSGSSDIRWKNKSHNLIESRGYGHGSDARNAAHKAAGLSGEEFDRIVKHGGDPFKRNQAHAARGMADVVTGPTTERVGNTTVHMGEGGKDELRIILPLERGQPIPPWALDLANSLSPDRDHLRGAVHMAGGGVIDATGKVVSSQKPFSTTNGVPKYTNSAGQVQARSSKPGKYTTLPGFKTAPMAIPQQANASVMARIWNTPSLRAAFNSAYEAQGGIADDFWAVFRNGLGMLGDAPQPQRVGRAF